MSIGLLFWVIFVFVFLFGGWAWKWGGADPKVGYYGGSLLILILLFLLGWEVFGFIIQK